MRANETHEKTLLEKIQCLEEQVQLTSAKAMEVATPREEEVTKTTKWKALPLEYSTKVVLFNQLLENQGEELYVILTEARL